METAVYMVILRTYYYMEETGRENSFERFPYLAVLTERLTEERLKEWEKDTGIQAMRYWTLMESLSSDGRLQKRQQGNREEPDGIREADSVLCTALDLCLAAMQVPEFAAYLNYYTGNIVTIQLAFELEGITYPAYREAAQRLKQLQKICKVDWKKVPLQYAAIEGENCLLAYLQGAHGGEEASSNAAVWFSKTKELHPLFLWQELAEKCARNTADSVIQICGHGGRRFLAKHTARLLKRDLLLVNVVKRKPESEENQEDGILQLVREAFLKNGIVCIYGITAELLQQWQMTEKDFWEYAVRPFCEAEISVILCTDTELYFSGNETDEVRRVTLAEPTRKEREAVFRGFAELYGLEIDCSSCSVRYRLSPSEIAKAVRLLHSGGIEDEMDFSRICYDMLCSRLDKAFGKVLYPQIGFADLKIPHSIRETLGQICWSAAEGYRIYEEWNLKQQYPYGRAVTVLLAGPPGTGKTMTAHALAKELERPLYQVDLSGIVNKYIGETEKHLEQVFAFAERTNMVLFFDEADALFGKRGEVTDSKDRYANMEVSYILQRIEQFEGIVVLATNFYNNIDKAFLRRMKYVLKYQAPDAAVRRSMWESCFPAELPKSELDLDYLAEQFDLTGGMIKNIALIACVMASYERILLDMGHVLRAVRAEYEKMERTVGMDMWGTYGYLMDTGKEGDQDE